MSEERKESPFKNLGERLKGLRQQQHESVAEVSGAVEIDEAILERFELGQERPSEDILMLLISHFGMKDDDADNLWKLAGYEPRNLDDNDREGPVPHNGRATVLIMAVDPRIVYSDSVQVTANDSGVVMNFTQGTGTPQQLTTAKVGMSREQARKVMHVLYQALEQSEPRQLPPSTSDSSQSAK